MLEARDLGVIDGPMLIFGGPYSNAQATEALLAEAATLDIPSERMLCSGDLIAYCADHQATVDMIREAGIAVVMGNCEESVGNDAEDCGCGFEEGSSCDLLSAQWFAHATAALDTDTKSWMRELPRSIAFTLGGRRLLAIHGGVDEINRFVFPSSPDTEKQSELDQACVDGIIGGHSGLPFTQMIGDRLWHNAGVIGMPANDGTPRCWYSLLLPTDAGIAIEHRAFSYDHESAARRMGEEGLPLPYAETLASGIWPDDGIMPEADRRARGVPIEPLSTVWSRRAAA